MSVYIKGLEMPTSCGFCPFENHTDDGYECRINGCLTEYQKRPSDCPLVPAADVVPVVQCGECEHSAIDTFGNRYCKGVAYSCSHVPDDWFCADGERKDGDA